MEHDTASAARHFFEKAIADFTNSLNKKLGAQASLIIAGDILARHLAAYPADTTIAEVIAELQTHH